MRRDYIYSASTWAPVLYQALSLVLCSEGESPGLGPPRAHALHWPRMTGQGRYGKLAEALQEGWKGTVLPRERDKRGWISGQSLKLHGV